MVGHPQKPWLPPLPPMRDIHVPPNGLSISGRNSNSLILEPYRRILVGVGPEAGWQDPYELELLGEHGFQVEIGALCAMLVNCWGRVYP